MPPIFRSATRCGVLLVALAAGAAQADASSRLAPGFTSRPAASRLVVIPADMELFSISAGGLTEPRADWTEAAQANFSKALALQSRRLGANTTALRPDQLDEFGEIAALHRAVADAVYLHHAGQTMKLPTKNGQLQWSLGDAVRPLKDKTGADYALFTWVRDTYASNERKAALVAMALLGAISPAGEQVGHASLVDLNTGRIVWFNDIHRFWGDLRDSQTATETVDALLEGFPQLR